MAVSPHIEMGFALGFISFLYFIKKFKFYTISGPFLVICVPIGLALENCGLSRNLILYFFGIMLALEIGWYLISYQCLEFDQFLIESFLVQ